MAQRKTNPSANGIADDIDTLLAVLACPHRAVLAVVEGWASFWLIHWMAPSWSAEQIRLYALCILVFQAIWFLVGLFKPELRIFWNSSLHT